MRRVRMDMDEAWEDGLRGGEGVKGSSAVVIVLGAPSAVT